VVLFAKHAIQYAASIEIFLKKENCVALTRNIVEALGMSIKAVERVVEAMKVPVEAVKVPIDWPIFIGQKVLPRVGNSGRKAQSPADPFAVLF
jgi:hypothetical protein